MPADSGTDGPSPPAAEPASGARPGDRLVEEELPPGFWEEAQEPHPPSPRQQRQVMDDPDRPPIEQVSAAPGGPPHERERPGTVAAGRASVTASLEDPAFETLQALFPGRILSIEADEEEVDEEADEFTEAPPEPSASPGESDRDAEEDD